MFDRFGGRASAMPPAALCVLALLVAPARGEDSEAEKSVKERLGTLAKSALEEAKVPESANERAQLFLKAARVLATAGERTAASSAIARAEAEVKEIESLSERIPRTLELATAQRINGEAKRAADRAREALELAAGQEEAEELESKIDALQALSEAHRAQGERELALADLREVERLTDKCGEGSFMTNLLVTARAFKALDDEAGFQGCLESALDRGGEIKDVALRRYAGEMFARYCTQMGWVPEMIAAIRSPKFGKPRAFLVNTALEEARVAGEEVRNKLVEYLTNEFPDDDKRLSIMRDEKNEDRDPYVYTDWVAYVKNLAGLGLVKPAVAELRDIKELGDEIAWEMDLYGECALALKRKGRADEARKLLHSVGERIKARDSGISIYNMSELAIRQAKIGAIEDATASIGALPIREEDFAEEAKRSRQEAATMLLYGRLERAKALCAIAEALSAVKRSLEAKQAVAEARRIVDALPAKKKEEGPVLFQLNNDFVVLEPPLEELAQAYCKIGDAASCVKLVRSRFDLDNFSAFTKAGVLIRMLADAEELDALASLLEGMKQDPLYGGLVVFIAYGDEPYEKVLSWVHLSKDPNLRLSLLDTIAHRRRDPTFRLKLVSPPPPDEAPAPPE